ncbi:MAG: DUF4412 domain-containing protein [Bacteroidota bacterium]
MRLILSILLFASTLLGFQHPKVEHFEGVVEYRLLTKNCEGEFVPMQSVGKLKNYYRDTFYKVAYFSNKTFEESSTMEIIVNTADTSRYVVKHQERLAESLGMEGNAEDYVPHRVRLVHENDTILGYSCKKYELLQLEYYTQQKTLSYVWVTEQLTVANLPLLAKIFSYRNSSLKDGSLGGITLKFESTRPDGSIGLRLEAIRVEPKGLDQSVFAVPTMYQRQ